MRHSNGKRSRGRSGRRPSPQQNINRAYDSNGPAGKLRGTAAQLVEKYVGLARDARVGRDRVLVENFLQHAEHYQRILNEIMVAQGAENESASDDDDQAGDDQGDNGHNRQSHGGQPRMNGGGRNDGNRNENGSRQHQEARQQDERQNEGRQQSDGNASQRAAVAGTEDQPDISGDVKVEVPPAATPSAPRAKTRRPRRTAAKADDAASGEAKEDAAQADDSAPQEAEAPVTKPRASTKQAAAKAAKAKEAAVSETE
jgi:hypothetical protein